MERSKEFAKLIKSVGTDIYVRGHNKYFVNTYQIKRNLENIDDKLILAGQNPKLTYIVVTKDLNNDSQVVCIKWIYEEGKVIEAYKDFGGHSMILSPSFNMMYEIVAEAMR